MVLRGLVIVLNLAMVSARETLLGFQRIVVITKQGASDREGFGFEKFKISVRIADTAFLQIIQFLFDLVSFILKKPVYWTIFRCPIVVQSHCRNSRSEVSIKCHIIVFKIFRFNRATEKPDRAVSTLRSEWFIICCGCGISNFAFDFRRHYCLFIFYFFAAGRSTRIPASCMFQHKPKPLLRQEPPSHFKSLHTPIFLKTRHGMFLIPPSCVLNMSRFPLPLFFFLPALHRWHECRSGRLKDAWVCFRCIWSSSQQVFEDWFLLLWNNKTEGKY